MTLFVFRETLMGRLLLCGNAYAQIIRDGRGRVIALYSLIPEKMAVHRSERGEIYYSYDKEGQEHALRNWEVLHIPGLGFDGIVGHSHVRWCERSVDKIIIYLLLDYYGGDSNCI